MNDRDRFNATMHYGPRDRCPVMDFGFWPETLDRWRTEGMPAGVDPDRFFGMDAQWLGAPIEVGLHPPFEEKVIEDCGETQLVRQVDGAYAIRKPYLGTIPHYVDWTLKDRASWEDHYSWRLDPATPGRVPADWPEQAARCRDRDYPLSVNAGSLYGWIRNWMGIENVSLLVYDDPDLFGQMVERVADCVLGVLERAYAEPITFDYATLWEDMCYNQGPLLSPEMFRRFLLPHYRRITAFLRDHGTDIVVLDCDGKIDKLIPLWLKGGVNCLFPIEVGTWNGDPVRFRAEYGRELRMMGGISKHVIARSRDRIDAAIDHVLPLVEEGGYIPLPDHRVPPDVPLDNYLYYIKAIRQRVGGGRNLRPLLQTVPNPSREWMRRFAWDRGT